MCAQVGGCEWVPRWLPACLPALTEMSSLSCISSHLCSKGWAWLRTGPLIV